jgi:hypothetical protein
MVRSLKLPPTQPCKQDTLHQQITRSVEHYRTAWRSRSSFLETCDDWIDELGIGFDDRVRESLYPTLLCTAKITIRKGKITLQRSAG